MNTKQNNKGFSLVELIVVIAIMGILAVTLAPRLTTYIEKARVASDREVVSAVMTTVRLGLVDENIVEGFIGGTTPLATETVADSGIWRYELAGSGLYTITGKDWAIDDVTTPYANLTNVFVQEIVNVVGDFSFKSNEAGANSEIMVELDTNTNTITVEFDYDTTKTTDTVYSLND